MDKWEQSANAGKGASDKRMNKSLECDLRAAGNVSRPQGNDR